MVVSATGVLALGLDREGEIYIVQRKTSIGFRFKRHEVPYIFATNGNKCRQHKSTSCVYPCIPTRSALGSKSHALD